jgi:hypothetical protein
MKSDGELYVQHPLRKSWTFVALCVVRWRSHLRIMFKKALAEIAGFQNQYVLNYKFKGKERSAPPPPSQSCNQASCSSMRVSCRKIRLIEGNAKCRHLKNLTVKVLCGRCLSIWGPGPPNPLPLTNCIRVYSKLIHTGKGGESWTREKGRGERVHKAGSKIPTLMFVSLVYKPW